MGIELRITSSATTGENTATTRHLDVSDLTIGCYNDDNVKLESQLLQGSHIRISSQWHASANEYRLNVTNISGNTPILLDNEPLQSDESREIKESTNIRMGQYSLKARDTSMSYFAMAEKGKDGFALESFSPGEFSLDTAMQSLLQPDEPESPETRDEASVQQNSAPARSNVSLIRSETSADSSSENTALKEIPTLQRTNKDTRSHRDETLPEANNSFNAEQEENSPVCNPERQTLFKGVIGTEDIVELNFDAYRLHSIRGRIIHHNQPLPGVVLDAGPLGVTRTDTNGNFCFDNIVEGTGYQIHVSCSGYMMAKTQVLTGTLNHDVEHNLDAIKLSRVTGRIVHDGTPLPGVTLDAGPYGICMTDANGYYHFDNVPENTDLEIHTLGAGFMFKRAGTAATINKTAEAESITPTRTPQDSDKELEDSLVALISNRQRVA